MHEDRVAFFKVGGKEVNDGVTYEGHWDHLRDGYVVVAKSIIPVFTFNDDGSWKVERQRSSVIVGQFKSENQFHELLRMYRDSIGSRELSFPGVSR